MKNTRLKLSKFFFINRLFFADLFGDAPFVFFEIPGVPTA
jgi:hypothetical protein